MSKLQRLLRVSRHVLGAGVCQSSPDEQAIPGLPLSGVRVVDCSSVIAGPTACALLADLGADVIRVEPPNAPDILRTWGGGDDPASTAMPALHSSGQGGSQFVQCNRGKRSIALDITKPAGVAVLKRMLLKSDVFVTNIRKQSLQKAGLDYEDLVEEFPRLIYAHVSGWGRNGPQASDPAYDIAAWWAQTGIMDLAKANEQSDMPRFPGGMGDNCLAAQLAGYVGIALFQRERTKRGQLVDAALLRSGVFAISNPLVSYAGGNGWGRGGVRGTTAEGERVTFITDACFKCKDGVSIQLFGIEHRRHMQKVLGALGLTRDDLTKGAQRWQEVDWKLATKRADAIFATKTCEEWEQIFKEKDVWHTRVMRFEEVWVNKRAVASGVFVKAPGVRHGLVGSPVILGGDTMHPPQPRCGAPAFGQHTMEVLHEVGISTPHAEQLLKDGIVK